MKFKHYAVLIAILLVSTTALIIANAPQGEQLGSGSMWYLSGGALRPNVATWQVKVPQLASCDAVKTDGNGLMSCAASTGGGSGTVATSTEGQVGYFDTYSNTIMGTSTLYIATSSIVGIGTTSPYTTLDIEKSVNGDNEVRIMNPNTGSSTASKLRVGIGNTAADKDTLTDSATLITYNGAYQGSGYLRFADAAVMVANYGLTKGLVLQAGAGGIHFGTGTTYSADDVMTIEHGGNVGIGSTTPVTKLGVNGVITATGGNSGLWNTGYDNASSSLFNFFSRLTHDHAGVYDINGQATSSVAAHLAGYNHAGFLAATSSPWGATTTPYDIYYKGNVGIGTTSVTKLFVVGASSTKQLLVDTDGSTTFPRFDAASTTATSTIGGGLTIGNMVRAVQAFISDTLEAISAIFQSLRVKGSITTTNITATGTAEMTNVQASTTLKIPYNGTPLTADGQLRSATSSGSGTWNTLNFYASSTEWAVFPITSIGNTEASSSAIMANYNISGTSTRQYMMDLVPSTIIAMGCQASSTGSWQFEVADVSGNVVGTMNCGTTWTMKYSLSNATFTALEGLSLRYGTKSSDPNQLIWKVWKKPTP